MNAAKKDIDAILKKLGIQNLNAMQLATSTAIDSYSEVVLLSPTGTGKTLAFLIPIIEKLDGNLDQIQALIVVPSRELAIQIEQVIREMGSGFKTNAVYGGRSGYVDRMEIKHPPAILIGTPGRLADHLKNQTISAEFIQTLVMDEFDKSLEVGFETDMQTIVELLPNIKKKILTSATQKVKIPSFMEIKNPKNLNFLTEDLPKLTLKIIVSPTEDKLETLVKLIGHIGTGRGIIFCNLKETIRTVSNYLDDKEIGYSCFYGGLEQVDRERALMKFRNGTHRLLLATDLAARGIDVPELNFIIHLELPPRPDEFIHRNGRTARMQSEGIAYILKYKDEELPSFAKSADIEKISTTKAALPSKWKTLHISGGRKDKISKGDIVGLFLKQGGLTKDELGDIELKTDAAFVAVPSSKAILLTKILNNSRLKTKKVRISILD